MNNLKQRAVADITATKTTVKNFLEFADAVALTTVATYAIYESLKHTSIWYRGLLCAGVLIALQAFVLLVRHFNK